MSDLYPTKTRLSLLADVDRGRVVSWAGQIWNCASEIPLKSSARVVELQRAGWVELPDGSTYWRLTDAGRAVRNGAK